VLAGVACVGAFYVWQATTAGPPAPRTAPARPPRPKLLSARTGRGPRRWNGAGRTWPTCGRGRLELELGRQRREELLRQAALEQKYDPGWPLLGRRPLFDIGSGLVGLGNLFVRAGNRLQARFPGVS